MEVRILRVTRCVTLINNKICVAVNALKTSINDQNFKQNLYIQCIYFVIQRGITLEWFLEAIMLFPEVTTLILTFFMNLRYTSIWFQSKSVCKWKKMVYEKLKYLHILGTSDLKWGHYLLLLRMKWKH